MKFRLKGPAWWRKPVRRPTSTTELPQAADLSPAGPAVGPAAESAPLQMPAPSSADAAAPVAMTAPELQVGATTDGSTVPASPPVVAPPDPNALPPALAIAGSGEQLFLSGGNQRVEDYLFGVRQPTPQSFRNFAENLKGRRRLAESVGARQVHVVCCDKQSVYREEYPNPGFTPLGERYRSACPDADFIYPVELLREARHEVDVYPPVDTHWSRPGELLVVCALLEALGLGDDAQAMRSHYAGLAFDAGPHAGDLGSKMDPVRRSPRIDFPDRFAKAFMDNRFGGNLGITKLIINPAAASDRRLLVFGDSFLNSCLGLLSDPFRYLLFVRTPFMHPDAVMMFKPTHIVTGNVERYLCHVAPDREAGCVLLAPVLRGHVLDPKNPLYRALDGVLSEQPRNVAFAMEAHLTALAGSQPEQARALGDAWQTAGGGLSADLKRLLAPAAVAEAVVAGQAVPPTVNPSIRSVG